MIYKNILIFYNLFISFYFLSYVIKNRFTLTSTILVLHIILYVIGFLVIGFNPTGPIWHYSAHDYNLNFIFPLGTGEKPLFIISIINTCIFLGIIIAQKIPFLFSHSENNQPSEKSIFYFGIILFLICTLYELARLCYIQDLPLMALFLKGGRARDVAIEWGLNKNIPWLFYSSIERQFLQILLPLSSLFLYSAYKKNKDLKRYFLISFFTTIFFLFSILKKTPLILYGFSIVSFCLLYKNKITDKIFLLCGVGIIGFGLIGMSIIHYSHNFPAFFSNNNPISKSAESIALKKTNVITTLPKQFKSSKIPIDFSKNMDLEIKKYNRKHYPPRPTTGLWNYIICRIFVCEMISSFVLCENEELRNFYVEYKPFETYLQKILGTKNKTIYEIMFNVLSGLPNGGAISISAFLEFYFLWGVLGLGICIASFILLIKLDIYLLRNKNEIWICFCAIGTSPLIQFFFKGSLTGLFTGGLLTLLFSIIFYYIFNYFYIIVRKKMEQSTSYSSR